ncbi:MAG: DUF2785 domain-containing protein, partial [Actinobacteria bacterium]
LQTYFSAEQDYRGLDRTKGFAHAIAHAADLYSALAASPCMEESEHLKILECIAAKLKAIPDWIFIYGEESRLAAAALAASGLCFLAVALFDSPLFPALSGLGFLGAVTSVMMLGHWFLTDPRLPRRPLFILTAMAAVSFALDAAYVLAGGGLDFSGSDGVFAMAYSALAALTGLLLAGVWFSLREPRYSGVMAATGLSYLAVLTAFGLVTLGRSLVAGGLS